MATETIRRAPARSPHTSRPARRPRARWLLLAIVVVAGAAVGGVFAWSGASLSPDPVALAHVTVGPFAGSVASVKAFAPSGRSIPITVHGGRLDAEAGGRRARRARVGRCRDPPSRRAVVAARGRATPASHADRARGARQQHSDHCPRGHGPAHRVRQPGSGRLAGRPRKACSRRPDQVRARPCRRGSRDARGGERGPYVGAARRARARHVVPAEQAARGPGESCTWFEDLAHDAAQAVALEAGQAGARLSRPQAHARHPGPLAPERRLHAHLHALWHRLRPRHACERGASPLGLGGRPERHPASDAARLRGPFPRAPRCGSSSCWRAPATSRSPGRRMVPRYTTPRVPS